MTMFIGGGGDEDDRNLRDLADAAAPVVAVEGGQRDVEQHEVRIKGRERAHHVAEILDAARLEIPELRLFGDGLRDAAVVLHD